MTMFRRICFLMIPSLTLWSFVGTAAEPEVVWAYAAQSNLYAPPLAADVHPAPGLEIILSDSEAKRLRCISADGEQLWAYDGGFGFRLISAAALSSPAPDRPRLLAIANGDGIVRAVDAATGREVWRRPTGRVEWGGALWVDLDGDGVEEAVIATLDEGIYALNADGSVRWRHPAHADDAPPSIAGSAAAADADGDGTPSLFFCAQRGPMALHADGALRWTRELDSEFPGSPVIADLRGGDAALVCVSRHDHALWLFDARSGKTLHCAPLFGAPDAYAASAVAVGDITQDGAKEIVVGDGVGHLCAFSADAELLWLFKTKKPTPIGATLGDVDGDGAVDILAASGDHCLYALDPLGRMQWRFKTDLRLIYPPTIADVNGDGRADILLCGSDRTLRRISLGGAHDPARMPWPSRRGNPAQTGAAPAAAHAFVAVTRSLLLHGGFEYAKTSGEIAPPSEGSDIAARRAAQPRGWVFLAGEGSWALADAPVMEGTRALRVRGPARIATEHLAVEPGLRRISAALHFQGTAAPGAWLEWTGPQGRISTPEESAATLVETDATGEWTRLEILNAPPPRAAMAFRLIVDVPESAEIFLDAAECTGLVEEPMRARALVNQAGYDIGAPKRFTVQANWRAGAASFALIREDGTEAYRGALAHAGRIVGHYGNDWGYEYWRGDFSPFEEAGRYRIRVMMDDFTDGSWPFTIDHDLIWNRTARAACRFFYYQRCGMEIPGYHGACHLDDAVCPEGKTQHELWGGWHDAGDYNKYHNAPYVYGLLRAYGNRRAAFDALDAAPDDGLLPEILWGAHHVRRMIAPDGSAFGPITSGYGYWGPPELETDNVPGTGDERPISGAETGHDPAHHHAALARLAVFTDDKTSWTEAAARSLDYALSKNLRGVLQFSTAVDLYAATGDQKYAALARELFPASITATQECVDAVRRYDAVFGEDHAHILRDTLAARAEEMLTPADNPFGVYTFGPPERPNFFGTPADQGGWHVGTSSHLLGAATIVALAHQYAPDARYLQFIYDQINWTLGGNPYDISLMEGVGSAFPPTYHQRLTFAGVPRGAIPGGIVNGITWRAPGDDRPFFDMSGVDIPAFEPNEVWLPHNTHYLDALSALYAARDSHKQPGE